MTPSQKRFYKNYKEAADMRGRGECRVLECDIEEIEGTRKVMAKRTYQPSHCRRVKFTDCYIVGPTGRTKRIYDCIA